MTSDSLIYCDRMLLGKLLRQFTHAFISDSKKIVLRITRKLWSPFISLYVYTVNVFIFLTWRFFTILLVLLVSKFKSNSKIVNHTLFWLWVSLYNFSNYSLFGMDKCSNSQKFMRLAAITVSKTPLSILLLLLCSFKIVRHSVI